MPDIKSPLDERLHAIVLEHLTKLSEYIPGAVKREGGKEELAARLANDPVFNLFGLDSKEYAAATLAGGTITSIHRKLGDIYEGCVKTVFMDKFGLAADEVTYSAVIVVDEKEENRTADVYLEFERLKGPLRERVESIARRELGNLSGDLGVAMKALGMEVRHCYQTADSKRTQADEAMGRHLSMRGILPIMPLFCEHSNPTIMRRYRNTWVVKQGEASYSLVHELSGYDFHDFMWRNREDFRTPVINLLRSLTT